MLAVLWWYDKHAQHNPLYYSITMMNEWQSAVQNDKLNLSHYLKMQPMKTKQIKLLIDILRNAVCQLN